MVETQLADEASASPPAPRGQRAGGPHAPEGVTTIGQASSSRARSRGRGSRHRRQGRRDDQAAATSPDGRSDRQGQGTAVGEGARGPRQGEREHPGERAGAYPRDRLGRRCDRRFAVGRGRRSALAGPRGRVGLGWEPHSSPARSPPISGLRCSCVSELPSVALTQRFLALCEHHGSQHLVVKLVAVGRGTGVPGLPESDDGRRGTLARCGPRSSIWSTCGSDKARVLSASGHRRVECRCRMDVML